MIVAAMKEYWFDVTLGPATVAVKRDVPTCVMNANFRTETVRQLPLDSPERRNLSLPKSESEVP
jgi:hypothetical protein